MDALRGSCPAEASRSRCPFPDDAQVVPLRKLKKLSGGVGTVNGRVSSNAIRISPRRGTAADVPARRGECEDVLPHVRLEPLRRRLAESEIAKRPSDGAGRFIRGASKRAHLRPFRRGVGDAPDDGLDRFETTSG